MLKQFPCPRNKVSFGSPPKRCLDSSERGTDCLCCALQPWPVETATFTVLFCPSTLYKSVTLSETPWFPLNAIPFVWLSKEESSHFSSRNSSCWKYWAKGISWVYVRTEFGREVWKCTISSMYVMYIINHCSTVSCWTYSVWMYVQSISLESCLPGTECGEGGPEKSGLSFYV